MKEESVRIRKEEGKNGEENESLDGRVLTLSETTRKTYSSRETKGEKKYRLMGRQSQPSQKRLEKIA